MNIFIWFCSSCQHENRVDNPHDKTVTCAGCSNQHPWRSVVHLSDDRTFYLNTIDTLSLNKHGVTPVDLVFECDRIIESLNTDFDNCIEPELALSNARKLQAKELWSMLGDIPVNSIDCLCQPFLHFPRGTDKHLVWHWFEDTFDCSIAVDLQGMS